MKKETAFIVVAKGSFTFASLGEYLNSFYRTDGAEIHFMFGTVPKDGFFIPHGLITKIKNEFTDWKERFEFFSREGRGKIREHSIPENKKSVKEKKAKADLAEIVKNKKGT